MNSRERLLAAFEHDLNQDLDDHRKLLALSQSLHGQLLQRDTRAVETTNTQLGALLEQVAARAQRRSRILGAFSLKLDEPGIRELLAFCGQELKLRLDAGWEALGLLVAACQQQNDYNGQILAMQHAILDHLLNQAQPVDIYAPQYY